MSLRLRVAFAVVVVLVPVLAIAIWAHLYAIESVSQDSLEQVLFARLQGEKGRCEASPEAWSGFPAAGAAEGSAERRWLLAERLAQIRQSERGPGASSSIQLYAYDEQFRSRNPRAPRLAEGLKEAVASGKPSARDYRIDLAGRRTAETLARTPWGEGPCAFVLARLEGSVITSSLRELLPTRVLLPAAAFALLSVLLAMGPPVRKIRRLTREVRESARGHYQNAITVGGDDEIGELARAFAEAGGAVREQMARQERREKTLRDFLENTTHDVMIPLTVLKGHLADLERRAARGEPLGPPCVAPAMNEAHYMAGLIHNLALAAKLEAGEPRLAMAPVDLGGVVERAVSRHAPAARQRAVTLDRAVPEGPVWVRGDVTLLEQAVGNVVYNAIRYNNENGHVAVLLERAVGRGQGGPGRFVLRVVDDGPGLPEGELSRLVERHFRGNAARTRDPEGRGLGLAIAFRVTQVHGFELRLSRAECGGLQVEFEGATSLPPAGLSL